MATIEISKIKETPSVKLLVDLAGDDDKILQDVGKKVIEDRMGHAFRENVGRDKARVQQGDNYVGGWTQGVIQNPRSGNVYERNLAEGETRVFMGTSYGEQ